LKKATIENKNDNLKIRKIMSTENKETAVKATSGTIGNLKWYFSNKKLTISGDGEIPYSGSTGLPWHPFCEKIRKIILKGNITKNEISAFGDCKNLKSVTFENPYVVERIDWATQGYSKGVLYNVDSWFCGIIPQILREYRRMSPEFGIGTEGWETVIDRMIFCFMEAMAIDCYGEKVDGEYRLFDEKTMKEKCELKKKLRKEGLELFIEHLDTLWY
jgi:hypothetical protein